MTRFTFHLACVLVALVALGASAAPVPSSHTGSLYALRDYRHLGRRTTDGAPDDRRKARKTLGDTIAVAPQSTSHSPEGRSEAARKAKDKQETHRAAVQRIRVEKLNNLDRIRGMSPAQQKANEDEANRRARVTKEKPRPPLDVMADLGDQSKQRTVSGADTTTHGAPSSLHS